MKKILIKPLMLLAMAAFSIHANAVYEGRNKSLEQYQSIRSEAAVAPMENSTKAYLAIDPTDPGGNGGNPGGTPVGGEPVSDVPLLFLLLGGAACAMYAGKKKVKAS